LVLLKREAECGVTGSRNSIIVYKVFSFPLSLRESLVQLKL